jgi:hypothetical protein
VRALRDGCLAELAPEAEALDRLQADAAPSVSSASDASDAALPDAMAAADLRREPLVADAGKLAALAPDVPARDAWSRQQERSSALWALRGAVGEPYKPAAAPSVEQSSAEPAASEAQMLLGASAVAQLLEPAVPQTPKRKAQPEQEAEAAQPQPVWQDATPPRTEQEVSSLVLPKLTGALASPPLEQPLRAAQQAPQVLPVSQAQQEHVSLEDALRRKVRQVAASVSPLEPQGQQPAWLSPEAQPDALPAPLLPFAA